MPVYPGALRIADDPLGAAIADAPAQCSLLGRIVTHASDSKDCIQDTAQEFLSTDVSTG
jgi:hypothetical protein